MAAYVARLKSMRPRRAGFTLLELLVAIGVMGVAVTVFISMYTKSLDLSTDSQDLAIARNLAEAQLVGIVQAPDAYLWRVPEALGPDPFPINLDEEDPKAGNPAQAPDAIPAIAALHEREARRYERFRWRAFGRVPEAEAGHVEVTVSVEWSRAGRPRGLSLTSAVPRSRVEALQ